MTDFSADISIYDDEDEGLRLETPETFLPLLSKALVAAGFKATRSDVAIEGTARIPALVEVGLDSGGTFESLTTVVHDTLVAQGIKVSTESFSSPGEKHTRFNLDNVSAFAR